MTAYLAGAWSDMLSMSGHVWHALLYLAGSSGDLAPHTRAILRTAHRTWLAGQYLGVIKPALPRWAAIVTTAGVALAPEPSPLGEMILLGMVVYLAMRHRRLMRVIWHAVRLDS